METIDKKRESIRPNNESYKEKYQILLTVNDNVICQRYFKINDFIPGSFQTLEFNNTMNHIVEIIKNEMVRKSRIYEWYTSNTPLKMTGFREGEEATYFTMPPIKDDKYADDTELKPYDITFKFSFLVDENPVYEEIWDGTPYQKYVRNSVDLLNNCPETDDILNLNFRSMLRYRMCNGESDKINKIIRLIYDTVTGRKENRTYTKSIKYRSVDGLGKGMKESDVTYSTVPYDKKWVDGWRDCTRSKTNKYMRENGFHITQVSK